MDAHHFGFPRVVEDGDDQGADADADTENARKGEQKGECHGEECSWLTMPLWSSCA